jgi:hypothetical protein
MNVDKNPAYPAAVEALKAGGIIPQHVRLRQCKNLNNWVEQDHRSVKKARMAGQKRCGWPAISSTSFSDSLPFNPELKAQATSTRSNPLVSELRNETTCRTFAARTRDLHLTVTHGLVFAAAGVGHVDQHNDKLKPFV